MFDNRLLAISPLFAKIGVLDKINFLIKLFYVANLMIFYRVFCARKITFRLLMVQHFGDKIYSVDYYGNRLYLKFVDLIMGLNNTQRESDIKYDEYISKGDVVCDVGAHIGTHTLKMMDCVGNDGVVVAIEPDLTNFGLLALNLGNINTKTTIIILNNALATKNDIMKLYHQVRSGFSSMHYSLKRQTEKYSLVNAITFSTLFDKLNNIDINLMKVDIEGAEEELFLNEVKTWEMKKIKIIILDTHSGVDYDKITTHLSNYGYKFKLKNDKYYFYLPGDDRFI